MNLSIFIYKINFSFSNYTRMQTQTTIHLLIGVSGSVATIKLEEIITQILKIKSFQLKVISTEHAKHFIHFSHLKKKYQGVIDFFQDSNEYQIWKNRGDPVLHIQLRKWADIYLVAPISANTIAKFANGISDNLISLVFRCWDFSIQSQSLNDKKQLKYPVFLCPAMNNLMYSHPVTEEHLTKLSKWNCTIIDSIQKVLMCGQKGKGAMQSVDKIIQKLKQIQQQFLTKKKIAKRQQSQFFKKN